MFAERSIADSGRWTGPPLLQCRPGRLIRQRGTIHPGNKKSPLKNGLGRLGAIRLGGLLAGELFALALLGIHCLAFRLDGFPVNIVRRSELLCFPSWSAASRDGHQQQPRKKA